MTDELKALLDMLRHNQLVRARLIKFANRLQERAETHDVSKFSLDEFGGYVEIKRIGRAYAYGSEAYTVAMSSDTIVKTMGLHHDRNSHHPDHHKHGVGAMGIFDVLEMVADWLAACEFYGTKLSDVMETQIRDYQLTPEQVKLIECVAQGFND